MGYSNFWEWSEPLADASKFAAWSSDVQRLLEDLTRPGRVVPPGVPPAFIYMTDGSVMVIIHDTSITLPSIICGPEGTEEPIITPTEVKFNGDASTNDDCEPFWITLHDLEAPCEIGGCKTLLCSYDILVMCALVRLAHYFPDIWIGSDGGDSAVLRSYRICQQVFGDTRIPQTHWKEEHNFGPPETW